MKQEIWTKMIKRTMAMGAVILAAAMMGCGLLGWLVCGEMVPLELAEYLILTWMAGAVGIGCFYAARTAKKRRLVVSVCTAAVVVGELLVMKCVFFYGQPLNLLLPLLAIVIAAILAGVLASREKTRRR